MTQEARKTAVNAGKLLGRRTHTTSDSAGTYLVVQLAALLKFSPPTLPEQVYLLLCGCLGLGYLLVRQLPHR